MNQIPDHSPEAQKAITAELARCTLTGEHRRELVYDLKAEFLRTSNLAAEIIAARVKPALDSLTRFAKRLNEIFDQDGRS